MASNRVPTTIRVCRKVYFHIEENATPDESTDATVRKLLRMKRGKEDPEDTDWTTKAIRVSQDVLDHIRKKARRGESRDQTLGRLFGISGHDGNVRDNAS